MNDARSGYPKPRVEPKLPADWGEAEHDAMSAMPGARDFVLANWQKDPRGVNGLGVMLQHPLATRAFLTFNNHVAVTSTIGKRERELLILRMSWLRGSEYEFLQHVVLGKRFGLSDADIERLQRGPEAPGWSPLDADLLRAVDELQADARIGDATWERLSQHLTLEQRIDLIYTVGCYEIAGMLFKTLGAQLDAGVEPLPDEVRRRMHARRTD
ncbi:carboxymuconolactone decarboxylase family protein [Sinimarinibacterium flocculans]|uniref:Alkylhydroperoxidase family enzyme n=2 Tax=Sinimarinibacterium flocculans TaxID=985250 RepID=A0A318EKB6_9GAMM|nr:carboxymuconolactone decarboxylase family protein [Sinimarinibacterium flocculans]PXV71284.1 alkylhydroperoxidase family enzyme [Sinimarinibacterium flocculans]